MSNLCSKANALGIWLLPAGTWWLETEVVHGSLGLCVQRISKLYSLQTKKGVDRVIYSYAVLELLFFIRVGLLRSGSRSSNRCLQEWWIGRILLNGFAASLKQLTWARWPRGLMFCSRSLTRGWPTVTLTPSQTLDPGRPSVVPVVLSPSAWIGTKLRWPVFLDVSFSFSNV